MLNFSEKKASCILYLKKYLVKTFCTLMLFWLNIAIFEIHLTSILMLYLDSLAYYCCCVLDKQYDIVKLIYCSIKYAGFKKD